MLWENVGATCGRPQFDGTLSEYGTIIDTEIQRICTIYPDVSVAVYSIMPDHIHMILTIAREGCGRPQVAPTISRIIQQFKGTVTKKIGFCLWQKSFFDRIIRSEPEYREIWQYIQENPTKWEEEFFL